jgi:hypothetical protein
METQIMNFSTLIALLEEVPALIAELKADGTVDKLISAEEAVKAELTSNVKLLDLINKLKSIKL